jgi:hypothetical protein
MYKYEANYVDFDGSNKKEDLWFHLTKAEITEMEYSVGGGLINSIQRLQEEQDIGKIIDIIKMLILKSFGEKIVDRQGRERFVKTETAREIFASTEAYSELFMSFLENPDSFNAFLIGILPVDMQKDVKTQLETGNPALPNNQVAPSKAVK